MCVPARCSVRKAGITAVRELLVCKAKVPAGDDPGSLHLNHIVPVVLRILRDESGSNECVAASSGHVPDAAHTGWDLGVLCRTKSQADEPPPYQFSNPHLPSYEASLHDLACVGCCAHSSRSGACVCTQRLTIATLHVDVLSALRMRCFESIAVLASNPLATHVVLDPTFA